MVAEALNKEWAATRVRVHHITAYYPGRGDDWVVARASVPPTSAHMPLCDIDLMYLNPSMLRSAEQGRESQEMAGHVGNPAGHRRSETYPRDTVDDAVKQIQARAGQALSHTTRVHSHVRR